MLALVFKPRMRPRIVSTAAALALAGAAHAQNVPSRQLAKPDAEFSEPFTAIGGVRELRDGRVIVNDATEKTLQLLDFTSNKAMSIGREGEGPHEYGIPARLIALPGDTTLLVDILNLRYLVILPDGKAGDTFVLDDKADRRMVGLATAVDNRGRFYFVSDRYGDRDATGFASAKDRVVFWRSRGAPRADTIAVLAVPAGRQTAARTMPGGKLYNYTNRPLHPEDVVAFAGDGRIAVVRASDYHVEWISPDGSVVKGPPVRYQPIRITEAEKQAFIEGQTRPGRIITYGPKNSTGTSAPAGGAGAPSGGAVPVAPKGLFDEKDMVWPAAKPPFLVNAATVAPGGRLWVLRTRAHNDAVPSYDVFDARGQLVERVVLPKDGRLVGFGAGTIYLARRDQDDLQYLQRFRVP